MTIQTLRYFIAVAEHRNFTKAAEACFVTQPTLSRAISELEEELHCRLINRTSRTVSLTPAGEVCLQEARRVLNACDRLTERVRETAGDSEAPLRIGYVIYEHLMLLFQTLYADNPEGSRILLEPQYGAGEEIKRRFTEEELDAVILPEPCAANLRGTEQVPLIRGRANAILTSAHPLYGRESIALAELADSDFVEWSSEDVPLLQAAYRAMCRGAGFEPHVVDEARKMGDMVTKLLLNNAVSFGTANPHRFNEDIRYIPLTDSPETFGLVCVWRRDDSSPQLKRLRLRLLEHAQNL